MDEKVSYSLSADGWGDGKSICMWRTRGSRTGKIARFQSDETAKAFAVEFDLYVNDAVQKRFDAVKGTK